jgi:NAD+ diphosphatase
MSSRIIFTHDQLWLRRQGDNVTFRFDDTTPAGETLFAEPLGDAAGAPLSAVDARPDTPLPAGVETMGLRAFFGISAPEDYALASRAFGFLHWRRTHRFCGRCGRATTRHATERAMVCDACHDLVYPRTNPVVIVRITRGREILLARRAHGYTAFFSVLAGFVEAAETLEHAAAREIAEEVGIRVKNLRYFASQPWPYPNNLMIAFTAEYESGDICVDQHEIGEAAWFTPENLPPIPSPISIARIMINAWLAENGK